MVEFVVELGRSVELVVLVQDVEFEGSVGEKGEVEFKGKVVEFIGMAGEVELEGKVGESEEEVEFGANV